MLPFLGSYFADTFGGERFHWPDARAGGNPAYYSQGIPGITSGFSTLQQAGIQYS